MHGFGASAENLLPLLAYSPESRAYNWILPLAPYEVYDPYSAAFVGYAWFPRAREHREEALVGNYFHHLAEIDDAELPANRERIEGLIARLAIPRERLIIGGLSQGAIMASECMLYALRPYAGALLFSGSLIAARRWGERTVAGPAAVETATAANAGTAARARTAANAGIAATSSAAATTGAETKTTPFFQTHGTADEVLPLASGDALFRLLQSKGFEGEFVSFEGGHTIPEAQFRAALTKSALWFKSVAHKARA